MTASKPSRSNKKLRDALTPRAMGDGDLVVYTPEERDLIFKLGLKYGRGLLKARQSASGSEYTEAFRYKIEIIQIFRGLPEHLRKRPTGQATKNAVLDRLKKIGITCSERTLLRYYKALGGAKFLRGAKPFSPGEDRTSPLEAYRRPKPNKAARSSARICATTSR
jgi:hypothetical protein